MRCPQGLFYVGDVKPSFWANPLSGRMQFIFLKTSPSCGVTHFIPCRTLRPLRVREGRDVPEPGRSQLPLEQGPGADAQGRAYRGFVCVSTGPSLPSSRSLCIGPCSAANNDQGGQHVVGARLSFQAAAPVAQAAHRPSDRGVQLAADQSDMAPTSGGGSGEAFTPSLPLALGSGRQVLSGTCPGLLAATSTGHLDLFASATGKALLLVSWLKSRGAGWSRAVSERSPLKREPPEPGVKPHLAWGWGRLARQHWPP